MPPSRRMRGLCLAAVVVSACSSNGPVPRIEVVVDTALVPTAKLPDWKGTPRPVAVLTDARGVPAHFVENELLVSTPDGEKLAGLLSRWRGEVLTRIAQDGSPQAPVIHLVRVAAEAADPQTLASNLQALDPSARGQLRVSNQAGLRLVAAAAAEAAAGLTVGMNWLTEPDNLRDRSSLEAPAGPAGYDPNAFTWSHLNEKGTGYRVTDAWVALDFAGRLQKKVKVAVIDSGFRDYGDFPAGTTALSSVPGHGPGDDLGGIWHGTSCVVAGFGVPDNAIGAAGPGGPVADLITVNSTADIALGMVGILEAVAWGAKIVSMSWHVRVPATLSWAVIPFNEVTKHARAMGTLLFASAGNQGTGVDEEDCAGVCWEEAWWTPCENDGVACIGGLGQDSPYADPGSNFGIDTVHLWAPYHVLLGQDPANPDNRARHGSGTSFSTPYVAGVAALIWAADPTLSADEVGEVLWSTAVPPGNSERRVNAFGAVTKVLANVAPSVSITSPKDGESLRYGGVNVVTLTGTAEDFEDGAPASIQWISSLPSEGVIATSLNASYLFKTPGARTITLRATDSGGKTGEASITINLSNQPPVVVISAPAASATLYGGVGYTFSGSATDPNQGPLELPCASLTWTSSKAEDGSIFPRTGCTTKVTFTVTGTRTLTLTAIDTQGAQGSASRTVNVVEPPLTGPPIVTIEAPANNALLPPQLATTLAGSAKDPDGGSLTYSWKVVDGSTTKMIGQGASLSWTPINDLGGHCGPKTVKLMLEALDQQGMTGSASVNVTLTYSPC